MIRRCTFILVSLLFSWLPPPVHTSSYVISIILERKWTARGCAAELNEFIRLDLEYLNAIIHMRSIPIDDNNCLFRKQNRIIDILLNVLRFAKDLSPTSEEIM